MIQLMIKEFVNNIKVLAKVIRTQANCLTPSKYVSAPQKWAESVEKIIYMCKKCRSTFLFIVHYAEFNTSKLAPVFRQGENYKQRFFGQKPGGECLV